MPTPGQPGPDVPLAHRPGSASFDTLSGVAPPPAEPVDVAAAERLRRLRERRVRPARAVALTELVAREEDALRRLRRRLGEAGLAWGLACPPELEGRATPTGYGSGTLTVVASDSASKYLIDRWLRSGGLRALQRASRAPIRRVQIRLGPA